MNRNVRPRTLTRDGAKGLTTLRRPRASERGKASCGRVLFIQQAGRVLNGLGPIEWRAVLAINELKVTGELVGSARPGEWSESLPCSTQPPSKVTILSSSSAILEFRSEWYNLERPK